MTAIRFSMAPPYAGELSAKLTEGGIPSASLVLSTSPVKGEAETAPAALPQGRSFFFP